MTRSLSPLEESAGRYACLLYDSTVKTVLGVQENEDLLIEILQFLIPGKRISSITVANKEKHGLVVSEKVVIFDLLCRDADTGEEFLVEVQNAPDKTFKDRALYYSLVPVREQMEKKQAEVGKGRKNKMDYSIKPVYVICLLNFNLEHESPDALEEGYVCRYELRNARNGERMTEAINFIFVEMDRLPYAKDEDAKCRNRLEKFIFAFKYMHTFEQFPSEFRDDSMLGRLAEASELANMSVIQREEYDKAMKDEFARLVENNFAREEGLAEGEAKGKAEGKAEIARAMLAEGMEPALIIKLTGFSAEELDGLTAEQVSALK